MDYREEDIILEEAFDSYAEECEDALNIALARIISAQRAIERASGDSPVDFIDSRVKTFESTREKCTRKSYDMTIDSIKKNVRDIAGIRIMTVFRDEIYAVVKMLHHIPGINVEDEKDYVKNPKPNGYSSYHMHVLIETWNPVVNGTKLIPIEIQIRSKSMDYWASAEHKLKYKNDEADPRVTELFKSLTDSLAKSDEIAIQLRDADKESSN